MSFRDEIRAAARAAGGSHKTVQNRVGAAERFADWLKSQNIQIRKIDQIKTAHLVQHIEAARARGLSVRTLQQEASMLRTTVRAAGRDRLASNLDNKDLGIAGASRDGTRIAMSDARYSALRAELLAKDLGAAACAELQRALGLRKKEAVMSPASLRTWARALDAGRPVRVIHGTKGGRPRDVHPADRERAAAAVQEALRAVSGSLTGNLIDKPDLRAAMGRYARVMHSCGATGESSGHALRYAFAQDQVRHYRADGFSEKEALAQTSLALGHGDGRGRYVRQVYGRGMDD